MSNQYRSVLASGGAGTGGDAVAANVLAGKTFTNDNGFDTGTMVNNGAVTQTLSAGQSYTIPEGYHNGNGTVSATGSNVYKAVSYNATSGTAAFRVGFEFSPSDLAGFTTITLTSNVGTFDVYYEADGDAYGSLVTGSSPITIPSFTTKLVVVIGGSITSHEKALVTATLS